MSMLIVIAKSYVGIQFTAALLLHPAMYSLRVFYFALIYPVQELYYHST